MKRIRPASVTTALAAIALGLTAAYAAKRFYEPAAPADDRVAVIVPAHNLPQYSRIRATDLEVKLVPPHEAPTTAFRELGPLVYRTTKGNLRAGEPILEEGLYPIGATPTLADELPPGFRAVTIAVDRINALGGLLVPQSFVDVTLTLDSEREDLSGVISKTILEGVKVLATSEQRFRSEERMPESFRSVTVAVTPEQANTLILAQQHGSLSVTLRGSQEGPHGESYGDVVRLDQVLGLPPQRSFAARVWRGAQRSDVRFEGDPDDTPELGRSVEPVYRPSIYRPTRMSSLD